MTDLPPAGWYPDPDSVDKLRYSDGVAWGEQGAHVEAAAPVLGTPSVKPASRELAWHKIPIAVRVLLGILFLPLTIGYAIYLMWAKEYVSKGIRVALTATGSVIVIVLLLSGCASVGNTGAAPDESVPPTPTTVATETMPPAAEAPKQELSPAEKLGWRQVKVVEVIDGDTLDVEMGMGSVERVRLIGIDCPEKGAEKFANKATAYVTSELSGKTVYLETDRASRDQYGRLLAYVWLSIPSKFGDTEIREAMFNSQLVLDGYADLMTIEPNTKYLDCLEGCLSTAKQEGRGLWAVEVTPAPAQTAEPAPKVTAKPTPTPTPAPKSESASGSYIANKNTGKFHKAGCASVSKMKPSNKVPYSSRDACVADGYVPCKNCNP